MESTAQDDTKALPASEGAGSSGPVTGPVILFLHGLESGVNGDKASYLERKFGKDHVIVPDMRIGKWQFTKNSYLTHAFYNLGDLFTGKLNISAMTSMLKGAVAQANKRIKTLGRQPDVVIASSFGCAVALEMMKSGDLHAPALLLAPAHKWTKLGGTNSKTFPKAEMNAIMEPWYAELKTAVVAADSDQVLPRPKFPIVVVHGDADANVNMDDTQELCGRIGAEFICAQGVDHSLNNFLFDGDGQKNQLEQLVRKLLNNNAVEPLEDPTNNNKPTDAPIVDPLTEALK